MNAFDCDAIATILRSRFADGLTGDSLCVSSDEHRKRICLRVVIERQDGSQRWIVEAGVSRPHKRDDEAAARGRVLDFLDNFLNDWFANERSERLRSDFQSFVFAGEPVFLRGRRRNLTAERMAAELLGEPLEADLEEVD